MFIKQKPSQEKKATPAAVLPPPAGHNNY